MTTAEFGWQWLPDSLLMHLNISRGGVKDTRLEANAKDTKNPRPRTTLPRTDSLEAKDRNARGQGQGPRAQVQVFSKKKVFKHLFQTFSKKRNLQKFSSGVLNKKKGFQNNFSGDLQNFNNSKNSGVLEPRTGQFSRTWGFETKGFTFEAKAKPRTSKWVSRTPPLNNTSLHKNCDDLHEFVSTFSIKPDVICLSEFWINKPLKNLQLL